MTRFFAVSQADGLADITYSLKATKPGAPLANRKIVLGSPKGGCGKTSTTLFVGSTLASRGASVLIIEATEGQAPLTSVFAHDEAMAEDGGTGLGLAMQRLLGIPKADDDYATARKRLSQRAKDEARSIYPSIRAIQVDPENPDRVLHFMPCAERFLSEVSTSPRMQQRPIRRALMDALVDGLIDARREIDGFGGWDFILFDVLPSAESPVMKAAMGIADAYALLVDMGSSAPLPGWGIIREELDQIEAARLAEGKDLDIFCGLIENRVTATNRKPPTTERLNHLRIHLMQRVAEEAEAPPVRILAQVRNLSTLALLGFNAIALKQLSSAYPEGIPTDLDELTDEDLEHLLAFDSNVTPEGVALEVGTGSRWLAHLFPSLRRTLRLEEAGLLPLVLVLAGDEEALEEMAQQALEETVDAL